MSLDERAIAEAELAASNPRYASPEVLAIRMAFWDLGIKNEPRCLGRTINPEDVSSCECMKAGAHTAAVCTMNEGFKCFMRWPLNENWDENAVSEKSLDGCNPNFPMRVISSSVPAAGAAIVDEPGHGSIIVIVLAILLLLGVWGRVR